MRFLEEGAKGVVANLNASRGFTPLADDPWVDRGNTGLAPIYRGPAAGRDAEKQER